MTSWAPTASTEVATPRPRRARRQRLHVAGPALWIGVAAVLLAGVVALNVAVLRLNLRMDHLGQQRVQLRAENAALASQLSSAADSLKIEQQATRKLGLVYAQPDQITYLDLSK